MKTSTTVTRRSLALGALQFSTGLLALGAASEALPRVGGALPPHVPDLAVPANNLRALVRLTASLEECNVPWWYDGTIFGVVPGENPRPLVKFEGMELYWMQHLPGGAYELTGNTVTFFRDVDTGAMLTEFRNPYTKAINPVSPAVQGGGPGRGFNYSVKGIRFTRLLDQLPESPLVLDWTFARDMVWLHNWTRYPPGLPPPRWQQQTMFASQKDFLDDKLAAVPVVFGSTVHMPWLKWLDMGDRPGHVVWHAGGAKLRSIDELPAEYRQRIEREYPALLSANPAKAAERAVAPGH
ncbi:MAG: DUF1838 family protein [Gammaproteobacteria bacterium]